MSAYHVECMLLTLGATIEYEVVCAMTSPSVGLASIGNLRLRYTDLNLDIQWSPEFAQHAETVDWNASIPTSLDELRAVLAEAELRGAAGEATEPDEDWDTVEEENRALRQWSKNREARRWIKVALSESKTETLAP